jgi:hypothetical protein
MRLVDLDPQFVGGGGEGVSQDGQPVPRREGVGLAFTCPCGCGSVGYVGFKNPLDGGPPYDPRPGQQWDRTGDTFETLTLSPSILRHPCEWHGYIRNGAIEPA